MRMLPHQYQSAALAIQRSQLKKFHSECNVGGSSRPAQLDPTVCPMPVVRERMLSTSSELTHQIYQTKACGPARLSMVLVRVFGQGCYMLEVPVPAGLVYPNATKFDRILTGSPKECSAKHAKYVTWHTKSLFIANKFENSFTLRCRHFTARTKLKRLCSGIMNLQSQPTASLTASRVHIRRVYMNGFCRKIVFGLVCMLMSS
jgi:hypothetical protein